jgi:hypothetical protein
MSQLSAPPQEAAAAPCPRCQKPLVDPHGLGWCQACGYCRSLAESETKTDKTPQAKPATLTATGSAIAQTPTWFWTMLVGLLLVVAATYACGRWLTFTPLERALLASVQMAAGFAIMLVGQFIALLRIAPEDSGLSFKDALFPFRLYGLVMKRLPSTRHTVYLGAWGCAAIVSAVIFIGGLEHWLNYLPGNQKNPTQKTKSGR